MMGSTRAEVLHFMGNHNLNRQELAKLLGVTAQAVDHWLTERRDASLTVLRLLRMFDRYPMLKAEFMRGDD